MPRSQTIDVRAAAIEDVDVAAHVLEDAIARARGRGFETWPSEDFMSAGGRGRVLLRDAAARGELFIVWLDGAAVATFTLQSVDLDCWPDAPPDGLYLHRLGVRRAGAGIGRWVLDWCKRQVEVRGRAHLRLDCLAADAKIRRYYEEAGFRWRGDATVGGRALSLLEWDLPPERRAPVRPGGMPEPRAG